MTKVKKVTNKKLFKIKNKIEKILKLSGVLAKMPINTLIVGLGKIGMLYDIKKKAYLTHSKCIQKNKNFNLVGGRPKFKKFKIFVKIQKPVWKVENMTKKKIDFVIVSTLPVKRYQIIKI